MITFKEVYNAIQTKYEADMSDFISDKEAVQEALENIDAYNGFLGDDRYYPMVMIDEFFIDKKPSEILSELSVSFDCNDNYFQFTPYGVVSTNKVDYVDDLGYDYVLNILEDYAEHADNDDLDVIIDNRDCANSEIKALEESEYYTESDLQEEIEEIMNDYNLKEFI